MLHATPLVSWIVLAFVGLREVLVVWTKATDLAETGEVLEERLHEVEAEVKDSRVDSCWNFQVRCDLTCVLTLLALLIITILATGWGCVRTCFHRAVVDRWRSEEWDCLRCPWWQGWYDDLLAGPMARVSDTGEEMGHERFLLRLSGRILKQGGARSYWWVRSPYGDVRKEDMSGTDPGAGPSGSSRLEDTEMHGGRRRCRFRALPTNRELLDWISEARDFASDC